MPRSSRAFVLVAGMSDGHALSLAAFDASERGAPDEPANLFTRYSAVQLARPVGRMEFLVDGLLPRPTYGQIAGEMKTLKSHFAVLTGLAVASATPLLGHFAVPRAHPVLFYVGEGGEKPFRRRLQRLAEASSLELGSLPFEASFDVAPVASPRFRASLSRDLQEVKPGLVIIDPWYAFHGGDTNPGNLYEQGRLLSELSGMCMDVEASLLIVNHFNQTGKGTGLKRITMAGSGEWADSWVLLSHRSEPQVPMGRFFLRLEAGSRQWGGTELQVDFELGSFNGELGAHDGAAGWTVSSSDSAGDSLDGRILSLVTAEPWRHTKTAVVESVGGNQKRAKLRVDALVRLGKIEVRRVRLPEGTRLVHRDALGPPGEERPAEGP